MLVASGVRAVYLGLLRLQEAWSYCFRTKVPKLAELYPLLFMAEGIPIVELFHARWFSWIAYTGDIFSLPPRLTDVTGTNLRAVHPPMLPRPAKSKFIGPNSNREHSQFYVFWKFYNNTEAHYNCNHHIHTDKFNIHNFNSILIYWNPW